MPFAKMHSPRGFMIIFFMSTSCLFSESFHFTSTFFLWQNIFNKTFVSLVCSVIFFCLTLLILLGFFSVLLNHVKVCHLVLNVNEILVKNLFWLPAMWKKCAAIGIECWIMDERFINSIQYVSFEVGYARMSIEYIEFRYWWFRKWNISVTYNLNNCCVI